MAISQFYKDNSHTDTFTGVKNPFTFKTTWDLGTLFEGDFDDSLTFSSNMLPFYHNYQYGGQFQYFTNVGTLTKNTNFEALNTISTKICLLYSITNTSANIKDLESSYYIYDSKTNEVGWSNIANFNEFRLVTEFPFDRLVVSFLLARNNYTDYLDYNYNTYDNITEDNQFNKFCIKLYYRNDDYTLTDITGYFVLAEVIKTDDNILLSTLSNKNITGTPTSFYTASATTYTEYCPHVKNNYFLHTVTSENMETVSGVQRLVPDEENTGLNSIYMWSWTSIIYYDTTFNKQLAFNICASLGLRFITCSPSIITDKSSYEEHVKLAYMDDTGYVDYKNILTGAEAIENSDTYNKVIDLKTSPDIPDKPTPYPEEKDKIEPIHARSFSELTGFIKYYKMTSERLDTFINACQQAGSVTTGFEYMPYITSVKQYPFNVNNYVSTEDHASTIKINGLTLDGSYVTQEGITATGHKLSGTQLPRNNIGTVHIPRKYNNFLDYAPYTTIEVYIPLCGWTTLPSHCIDKDIAVILIMDVINGTCKGVVECDGIPVAEKSGICGRDIALSGIETGLKTASVISSASGIASSALGVASGVMTGNPVAVGYSAVSAISATSQMLATMNNSYTRTTGNMGDITNFHDSSCCYLKITTPVNTIPESYGKNVGYVCNKTKQLSTCKGYTVIENPELNLNCNYDEEQEIKSLLQAGIIIK